VAAGSPEALIVSEFRVDGNPPSPRAVLHPPAFLPRCLDIHTYIRLSYVTAANEEEQKYENATRRTGGGRSTETERQKGERVALKRFPALV
jgi:hypothetical protein